MNHTVVGRRTAHDTTSWEGCEGLNMWQYGTISSDVERRRITLYSV